MPFTRMFLGSRVLPARASYFENQQAASKQVSFHQLRRTRPYLPGTHIVVDYERKHRRCTFIRQTLIILSSNSAKRGCKDAASRSPLVFAVNRYLPLSFSFLVSLGGRNLINHRACLRWPGNMHLPSPSKPPQAEFDKRRLLSQSNNSPISISEILIRIRPSRRISSFVTAFDKFFIDFAEIASERPVE